MPRQKHQERLVLRLPAKPGDCPIIAISIFTDCDCVTRIDNVELSPDPIAVAYPRRLVVDDNLIRDLLDQPATECRCRNPEDDVSSGSEVWLFENAALSTSKTRDGEYVVDAAIGSPIRIQLEPHFPHRPIVCDEGRQSVGSLEMVIKEDELGVLGRTCSTRRRLGMAAAAAVEIHGWPQTIFDCLSPLKLGHARVEQRGLT